jgi:hypothetical protein
MNEKMSRHKIKAENDKMFRPRLELRLPIKSVSRTLWAMLQLIAA